MSDLLEIISNIFGMAVVLAAYAGGPVVGAWLQLFVHEFAHAVMTWLLGGNVSDIKVGSGRHVWSRALGQTVVELRPFLGHGLVYMNFPTDRWWRTRMALVYLAGPVASTLIAVACVSAAWHVGLPDPSASWNAVPLVFLGAAAFGTGLGALIAWLPTEVVTRRVRLASDILNLLRLVSLDDAAREAAVREGNAAWQHHLAWRAFYRREPDRALELLAGVDFLPEHEFARQFEAAFFTWAARGPAEALRVLDDGVRALAEADSIEPETRTAYERAMQVNRLFFLLRLAPEEPPGEEALAIAAQLERHDDDAAVARTIALGRLQEGRPRPALILLRRAWEQPESANMRAITALYQALGHAQLGSEKRATRWLRKARRLDPNGYLLEEFEARVAAALNRSVARTAGSSGPARA